MFVELIQEHMGQKAGFRFDTDDVVAKALIEKGVAKTIGEDPLAPIIAKSMESMLTNVNQTIEASLKDFAANFTKSRKNAVPAIFGPGGEGDPKKTFGRFLLAVRNRDLKALEEMGSEYCEWEGGEKKAAMATSTGTTGGYLVPTEFHQQLMQLAAEKSVVRGRATVIPMASREVDIPVLDVTTAPSAGDSAFLGGVVARWTEEASSLNQTEPALKQAKLTNYELSGYSKISNSLLADSAIGLEMFLRQIFGSAIAWYQDYAFFRGNGVGKPLGIVNWAGLISVTRSGASAFALADAAGMFARLLPGWDPDRTVWAIHPTVVAKLLQMTGGQEFIFLTNHSITGKPIMTILGIPVAVSEKLPGLNTVGDVLLCDMAHYLIGDRERIEIAFSEHAAFTTNQTLWRFVSRVGGMPWLRDKVTLSDASNTLAPFVALAAG